jgi:large subunit ribosomal protein L32e
MKRLMEIKSAMKKRRPSFKRQEFNKRIRLSRSSWRKPRGVDSKMREQWGGYRAIVKIGYGTPRKLRGRLSNGLIEVKVSTVKELNSLTKDQIAVIPRTMGNRRRLELLKEALKFKILISNFRNIESKIKEIESNFEARKKRRQELKKEKVERLKSSKKPLKSDKKKEEKKIEEKSEIKDPKKEEKPKTAKKAPAKKKAESKKDPAKNKVAPKKETKPKLKTKKTVKKEAKK